MKVCFDLQRFDTDDVIAQIPSGAFKYKGHYYYIYNDHNIITTFYLAESYCRARGGYLAVINDSSENTALFNYMKSAGYDNAYFGLTDSGHEGTWTWDNGDTSKYRNWAPGEPNGNTVENYGMFYFLYNDGLWNDGDFGNNTTDHTRAFICEWDSASPTGLNYNDDRTIITASKKFNKNSFSMISYFNVKDFNGSKITRNVKITGNSIDNKISGGTKNDKLLGGAGNDTLVGGEGNDTLTGGKGDDVFVYSAGNDVIRDYKSEDSIYFDGVSVKSWEVIEKNIVFTTDNGNLTVKNGKDKEISITIKQVYSNVAELELFTEDNFTSADKIDSIVEKKFAVAEFENFPEEKISQGNIITFAK